MSQFFGNIMKYKVEYSAISDIHTVIKIFDFSTFLDDYCENKASISFNGCKRLSKKELVAIG